MYLVADNVAGGVTAVGHVLHLHVQADVFAQCVGRTHVPHVVCRLKHGVGVVDGSFAWFPFHLCPNAKTARMLVFGRQVQVVLGYACQAFALVFAAAETEVAEIVHSTKGQLTRVCAPRIVGNNGV